MTHVRPITGAMLKAGPAPCRYCAQPLASPLACQCFACGFDWRDAARVVQRGTVETRHRPFFPRRRARGFWRLTLLCACAQVLLAAVILLLVQLPKLAIVCVAIAAPTLSFVLHKGEPAAGSPPGVFRAARWSSGLRKLLAMCFTGIVLLRPDWLAVAAIGAMGVVCAYWFVVRLWRRTSPTPIDIVLLLLPAVVFAGTWMHNPHTATRAIVLTVGAAELIDLFLMFRGELRQMRAGRK